MEKSPDQKPQLSKNPNYTTNPTESKSIETNPKNNIIEILSNPLVIFGLGLWIILVFIIMISITGLLSPSFTANNSQSDEGLPIELFAAIALSCILGSSLISRWLK